MGSIYEDFKDYCEREEIDFNSYADREGITEEKRIEQECNVKITFYAGQYVAFSKESEGEFEKFETFLNGCSEKLRYASDNLENSGLSEGSAKDFLIMGKRFPFFSDGNNKWYLAYAYDEAAIEESW